jgi:hypothetical protein
VTLPTPPDGLSTRRISREITGVSFWDLDGADRRSNPLLPLFPEEDINLVGALIDGEILTI